jgi:hypothetical protein
MSWCSGGCLTRKFRSQISDVRCQMSDVRCSHVSMRRLRFRRLRRADVTRSLVTARVRRQKNH